MFSVFDGHGGCYAADLLGKTLHGVLAHNAGKMLEEGYKVGKDWENQMINGNMEHGLELGDDLRPALAAGQNPQSFAEMLSMSFMAVDANLLKTTQSLTFDPQFSYNHLLPPNNPSLLALANLFDMGSCAITAVIDVENDKLFVANVGDTRAVAGCWDPAKSKWRCDILTEDATCENEKEVERIRSEHPEDERFTAVFNQGFGDTNRVHGGLQISRAFGDDAYKLNHEEFKGDIHPVSGEELKFVILATDGLWDRMTSEEASYLLASHFTHEIQQDVSKVDVMAYCPHTLPAMDNEHPYPKEELNVHGKWVYEDANAATHLIRNAIGGEDRELRRQLMSMKRPGARSVRDDTTAIVIWFDDPQNMVNKGGGAA
ncbi:uncharacterized protein I206_100955 [Kwoniella pini CBS 10737]|uniref:PPM-type phosphatase domain-containing protein n=1 Tax=Kwoniella pini CBS 10737 TaxID=1296096 RepID=A0A1B9ICG0_9TREE|nr:uncharacterized protein I206_00371 [Kwoniella pini CBS 10737]OCF53070.1 hypothetical protein I206_00371 [Kwoniella pini CBS 10737]